MENQKVKATKEMVAYLSELNFQSNKRYSKTNTLNKLLVEKKNLIDDISTATIGYGVALKLLEEKKQSIENEIKSLAVEISDSVVSVDNEFVKKFGISSYKLDFNSPVSEGDDLKPIIKDEE